jgi:DNA replication protein DnaC
MKLFGMAEALVEHNHSAMYSNLPFEERLGLLIDREMAVRDNRRLANLLRGARLRYPQACPEEIDFRTPRGLAKDVIVSLMQNGWIKSKQNVIITGPHRQRQDVHCLRPCQQRLPKRPQLLLYPAAPAA